MPDYGKAERELAEREAEDVRLGIRTAEQAKEQSAADRKHLDSGCPPEMPYRSRKEGSGGACVEQPDNCPDGMTAHGLNGCISASDPRAGGGGGGGGIGSPAGGGIGAPAAPEGLADLVSSGVWGRVSDMFNLGTPEAGARAKEFKVTGDSRTQGVGGAARLLKGGGLMWGGAGGWGSAAGGGAAPAAAPQGNGVLPGMGLRPQPAAAPLLPAAPPGLQTLVDPASAPQVRHPMMNRKIEELLMGGHF